jgi:hypothetical protein
VHRLIIIWRIGGVRRLPWPSCHLDTADEYQYDGYHDEPSMQIHQMGFVTLELLFLTLPTPGLTGQHVISSGK